MSVSRSTAPVAPTAVAAPASARAAGAGWLLCAGTAVALGATMTLAASLQAWRTERALYRPLAVTSAIVTPLCLAPAAAGLAPLPLAGVLIVLLAIPWCVAVGLGAGGETEDEPGADPA